MVQMPLKPLNVEAAVAETAEGCASASVIEQVGSDWDSLDEEWLSDEPELESDSHRDQIDSLLRLMKGYFQNHRPDVYCSGNTTVYYDESQRTNRNFRGPDIYVVMGADPRPRNSWMVWREGGRYPNVVIELLSDSTAKVDRTTKKELYRTVWRVPNYFWLHPRTKEFRGFRLVGRSYREIKPNALGHLWSDQMELFLGLHEGMLRLFTPQGELVLLEEEAAAQRVEQERLAKEAEAQRAEAESQRAEQEKLAKEAALEQAQLEAEARRSAIPRLAGMGLSVAQIAEALGLSIADVEAGL